MYTWRVSSYTSNLFSLCPKWSQQEYVYENYVANIPLIFKGKNCMKFRYIYQNDKKHIVEPKHFYPNCRILLGHQVQLCIQCDQVNHTNVQGDKYYLKIFRNYTRFTLRKKNNMMKFRHRSINKNKLLNLTMNLHVYTLISV